MTAGGFTVDRRQIVLDKPIKTLGLHPTRVALHPEVIVQVSLNVARSEDEAERQARGEDVTVVKEEALQLETFNPDAAVRGRGPGPPARRGEEEGAESRAQGLSPYRWTVARRCGGAGIGCPAPAVRHCRRVAWRIWRCRCHHRLDHE